MSSCLLEWHCHCVVAFTDPMYCIWAVTYCGHWQSVFDCCCKIWSGHVSIRYPYPYELKTGLFFFPYLKLETVKRVKGSVLAVTFWKAHRGFIGLVNVKMTTLLKDTTISAGVKGSLQVTRTGLGCTRTLNLETQVFNAKKRCDFRTWCR